MNSFGSAAEVEAAQGARAAQEVALGEGHLVGVGERVRDARVEGEVPDRLGAVGLLEGGEVEAAAHLRSIVGYFLSRQAIGFAQSAFHHLGMVADEETRASRSR